MAGDRVDVAVHVNESGSDDATADIQHVLATQAGPDCNDLPALDQDVSDCVVAATRVNDATPLQEQ
jgi:hypothetical protein